MFLDYDLVLFFIFAPDFAICKQINKQFKEKDIFVYI